MTKELCWGIIGCGVISHDFARSLKNCKHRNKIVAVGASSSEKSQEFLREFGLDAKAYEGYQGVLDDHRVEVVYIGLMNFNHLEWILKALDAGKHVLCEKPMVINSTQIKQLMEKAKEKKKFVMEAFWSRFFPAWRKIREIIESKELGALKSVGMNFCQDLAENRFHLHKDASPLIDIGYYVVGLSMYAFDDQKPEKAEIACEKKDGVDHWGNITLRFKQGGYAVLHYNGALHGSTAAFLAFEKGLIELPQFFWSPERMIKTTGHLPDGKQEQFDFSLKDYDGYNLPNCAGLHYEADHVFEQIQEGRTESPIMCLTKTKQIVETLDGLREQIGVVYKHD